MIFRPALLSRCLVFAALLCALGLQLGETLHSHGLHDSAVECLFCKGNPGAPAVQQASQFAPPALATAGIPREDVIAARQRATRPTARGPPHHS